MFEHTISKLKKDFNKDVNHKIDAVNDRLVDAEDELAGYEELFNDVFDNFRKIMKQQAVDREMMLDLVFALASAAKIKPNNLSRHIDEKKLTAYANLFNEAQIVKKSKDLENAMQKAKDAQSKGSKSLDKKAK